MSKVAIGQTELTQLLLNIAGNSVQAFPNNSLGKVKIKVTVEGSFAVFTIADNGSGIPPEILAKVGTPFFTTKDEGTGLGVAQCRRLVGNARGDLTLDSTVGKGTTVRFTIPLAPTT